MTTKIRPNVSVGAVLVIAFALAAAGCENRGPTAPNTTTCLSGQMGTPPNCTTPPAPTTMIRIVDGLTGAPIAGAMVNGDDKKKTNADGSLEIPAVNVGSAISVTGAAGYRDRSTLYCGGEISLWLNKTGDVDDALTRAIGYSAAAAKMLRPESVSLVFTGELATGSQLITPPKITMLNDLWRDKARYVSETVQGKTPISLTGGNKAIFLVGLNPAQADSGTTSFQNNSAGEVTGGTISFKSFDWAMHAGLVVHEITHSLGINGLNPYDGVLNGNVTKSEFTEAEKNVLRLRYTRPLGALFAGDDDRMVACSAR